MDVNTPHDSHAPRRRPLVVGIDGSSAALRAAEWAAGEAVSRGVALRLVAVLPDIHKPPFRPGGSKFRSVMGTLEKARAAVTAGQPSGDDAGAPVVESRVLWGLPEHVLVEQSRTAGLIVLGSTDIGLFSRMVLGSTTLAVTRDAHCPVALIRPAAAGPVLAVVAECHAAGPILEAGFRAAAERDADLIVARIWRGPSWSAAGHAPATVPVVPDAQIQHYQHRFPDVVVYPVTVVGETVEAIEQFSTAAQLVVTGNDTDQEYADRLSPLAHDLICRSPSSVLIIPDRSMREPWSTAAAFTRS